MPNLDLSKAVSQLLEEYGEDVDATIKKTLDTVGKKAAEVVRAKSPTGAGKKSGSYKKGWRSESVKVAYGINQIIVHNRTDWMLTHLLNNGFYSVRAKRRIPGDGHLDKAETEINELLIKEVEDSLK